MDVDKNPDRGDPLSGLDIPEPGQGPFPSWTGPPGAFDSVVLPQEDGPKRMELGGWTWEAELGGTDSELPTGAFCPVTAERRKAL